MYRVVLCVVFLWTWVNARELPECPESSSSTTAGRLRSSVLCDYDSLIRPVKDHRNVTTVKFRLMLKYFQYEHFTHTLSVDAWFTTFWTDEHLRWKPEDYDGIKSIHLSSSFDIWVPDISIYNRKDQSTDPKAISDTTCSINYKGTVMCVPAIHFDALCVPNLRRFPYDTQECVVRFGSWAHKGEEINLTLGNPMVDTEDLESNGEWELVKFRSDRHRGDYACCPNSTYPSIDITFEIKRNGHTHAINVILPLIVCIWLTIATMAMSPLNKDRFVLSCVSMLSHIIHVQNMSYTIPVTGDNLPSLVSVSRDSTLLAGISVIATVLLKNMMQNKSQSPSWLAITTSVLVASRPGQLIFLPDNSLKSAAASEKQEDSETIISNVETPINTMPSDWLIFAKFIDVLLLTSYILAYFIMLVTI